MCPHHARPRFVSVCAGVCGVALLGASATYAQYTAAALHPAGYVDSQGKGIGTPYQVGNAEDALTGLTHALLWTGTPGSVVDLNPPGFTASYAEAVWGLTQIGRARDGATGNWHAFIWGGSAGSGLDLNPVGYYSSEAYAADGVYQYGFGAAIGIDYNRALRWEGSHDKAINMHPLTGEYTSSWIYGAGGGFQAGAADGPGLSVRAMLWANTPESALSLHPPGYTVSLARDTDGVQQVGEAVVPGGLTHALLWSGTASSAVDLNPPGFSESYATSVAGGKQVGAGKGPFGIWSHALRWEGTPGSYLDLHTFLPPGFMGSAAWGIDEVGNIVGTAVDAGFHSHAVVWFVPEPGAGLLLSVGTLLVALRRGFVRTRGA